MVFIAILLAFSLERFFDWGHLRNWQWFERYCQMLAPSIKGFGPALRFACQIVPPVLAIGLVEYLLAGWLYGLLRFLFDCLVLLYCFGPQNFWAQFYGCLQALSQGDAQLLNKRMKAAFPDLVAPTSPALHQALIQAVFLEGERRIFGVLFWFAIFGPMGAVLYRLTAIASKGGPTDMASLGAKALAVLDWLPARVLGILFALGGHFVKVFNVWQKYALQGLNTNETLIMETGLAALDLPPNKPLAENGDAEKQAIQLFDRALIIMLVLAALLILLLP